MLTCADTPNMCKTDDIFTPPPRWAVGVQGAGAYTDGSVMDVGGPVLSAGAWAVVLADDAGNVLRVVMGEVAGDQTVPRPELHAALWVAEGAAGAVCRVTDRWYKCDGAAAVAVAPGGPAARAPYEGRDGGLRRRLAACPPCVRRVPAHTKSPAAGVPEVDSRRNGVADAHAKCAAALARIRSDWRAERAEASRHLRTVHAAFAVVEVALLAQAYTHTHIPARASRCLSL